MEKITLGIKKLDKLLQGGVFPGTNIMFIGLPGTAKSLFIHLIMGHLLKNGFKVLFVSTDRSPEQIKREFWNLGIDYDKYIKEEKLIFVDVYAGKATYGKYSADIRDLTSVSLLIDKLVNKLGENVVQVFDVLTELFIWTKDDELILRFVSEACARTREHNAISFFVINEGMKKEDYINSLKAIVDGVIELGIDDKRWLKIEKMSALAFDPKKIYFKITKTGKITFLKN